MKQNRIITNHAQLAEALGMSRHRIAWHTRQGKGPKGFDPDEWLAYFAAQGRDRSSAGDKLHKAIGEQRLAILKEDRHAKRRENRIKDGQTVTTAYGQRFVQDLIGNCFFGQLDRLSGELPATLKGKTEIQIKQEVVEQIERIKRLLRDKLDEIMAIGKQAEKSNYEM